VTTLYKLTRPDDTTTRGTRWGPGVTRTAKGDGEPKLCSRTVIHAYRDPLLALLMDPIQAGFGAGAHLWEATGEVVVDDGTKVGCRSLTTVRRLRKPRLTTEQRVRFAILAAKAVYHDPAWLRWADGWLDGSNRGPDAADAAAWAAEAAWAAKAAAAAAEAEAAEAAWAAAAAAAWAAARAGEAAREAAAADRRLDLVALAQEAVRP